MGWAGRRARSRAGTEAEVTSDGDLCDAAPLVLHLAEVDAVVVGAGVADGQAPHHAVVLHHVLVAGLQLPVLQEPGGGDGLQRHVALQHRVLPLRHLHILQLHLEPHPVLCRRERRALSTLLTTSLGTRHHCHQPAHPREAAPSVSTHVCRAPAFLPCQEHGCGGGRRQTPAPDSYFGLQQLGRRNLVWGAPGASGSKASPC